ncbi:hypothetical protein EE612_027185, partial [Oryza sativa]
REEVREEEGGGGGGGREGGGEGGGRGRGGVVLDLPRRGCRRRRGEVHGEAAVWPRVPPRLHWISI